MSIRSYFTPETRKATGEAVSAFESHTSAELVVALHDRSDTYRDADFLTGFICALAGLCVFLFHPAPFRSDYFPLEMTLLFLAGTLFSAWAAPYKRLVLPAKRMDASVKRAARAAFYELGLSKTKSRTGILIFVSAFERRLELVSDIGAAEEKLGPAFAEHIQKMRGILRRGESANIFLAALKELGPIVGKTLPRAPDDINELGDEVRS